MFRKVLIANRGEVALRVLRACREMGCAAVVVYEPADITSLHVRLADECAQIDGPRGYFDVEQILSIAEQTGVDAIHPGYGFLSENLDFIRACKQEGLAYIGPSEETAALAKNWDGILETARSVGYEVIDLKTLDKQAENIGQVLRKVEIQILGDREGHRVHLGERQSPLSMDIQPFLAEAPAPFTIPAQQEACLQAAMHLAQYFHVTGVATIEFLVDQNDRFYFTGLKISIDPQHALTEMITQVDLVREQMRIASGEPLGLEQDQIHTDGFGMTCCITAVDAQDDLPACPCRLDLVHLPAGIGVRVDSHIYAGCDLPEMYDPLIARITVSGSDRISTRMRMRRALEECQLGGIQTNLWFLKALVNSPEFLQGSYPLLAKPDTLTSNGHKGPSAKIDMAAVAALLYAQRRRSWVWDRQEDEYRKHRKHDPVSYDETFSFLRRKMR